MQVSHVEKNMVKQSSTVPNEQSGVLKPYPGLDLIDPESSCMYFLSLLGAHQMWSFPFQNIWNLSNNA